MQCDDACVYRESVRHVVVPSWLKSSKHVAHKHTVDTLPIVKVDDVVRTPDGRIEPNYTIQTADHQVEGMLPKPPSSSS